MAPKGVTTDEKTVPPPEADTVRLVAPHPCKVIGKETGVPTVNSVCR